ncbi:hypothetical protein ACQ4PT_017864 [Festuca glaucescens]
MESQSVLRNARPWASLSPDLLQDITGRLHDATDFVRFHAVCQPWRDTATRARATPRRRHMFLPWLLSRYNGRITHSPVVYFGRVSSEPTRSDRHRSYNSVVLVEPGADGDRNWVAREDGGAAWLFFAGLEPTIQDVVTRAVTYLPRFPNDDNAGGIIRRRMRNPRGILYCDGTVFLYSFVAGTTHRYDPYPPVFTAAILRPGEAKWTVVQKMLDLPASHHSCAAYHGGKVLVWVGAYFWCVLTPDFSKANGGNTANIRLETTWDRLEDELYIRDRSYIFVSRGELLRVSVLIERQQQRRDDYGRDYPAPTLALTVHALEEGGDGGKMHWVERDDSSIDDRVMFLGSPASFAMDATQLGLDGGCAYLTFGRRVFRYSFFDGEAKPVDWLFPGWDSDKACVWLRP